MLPNKNLVQVAVPAAPGSDGISGSVAAAAVYGLMVALENDSNPEDTRKLVPATNMEGFLLEQEVVSAEDFDEYLLSIEHSADYGIRSKSPVGKAVSARDWRKIHVDKVASHVDTDNLDENTAVKTPLKLVAGKWTPCDTDGDVISGILERKLTPKVAANTVRFEIRKMTGIYTEPAA